MFYSVNSISIFEPQSSEQVRNSCGRYYDLVPHRSIHGSKGLQFHQGSTPPPSLLRLSPPPPPTKPSSASKKSRRFSTTLGQTTSRSYRSLICTPIGPTTWSSPPVGPPGTSRTSLKPLSTRQVRPLFSLFIFG